MTKKTTGLVVALAGLSVTPLAAHHSFDGSFDRNKSVTLSGTVADFEFANPHSYFVLAVVGPDGSKREWHVETTSAGSLASNGWTAHSITTGERLEIDGWPARNGNAYVRLRQMRRIDGQPLDLWMPPGP